MSAADIDFQRNERLGFPEIVYGEFKSVDQLRQIAAAFADRSQSLLVTRLQPGKAAELPADGEYDPLGRTYLRQVAPPTPRAGSIGVVSAGTSDAPVVREAAVTLRFLGCTVETIEDAGVAGVHRLLGHHDRLAAVDVIICVAGFEGALASVIAGLYPQPIIGVPTSVGYGVATGGQTALHSMLASCANGVLVTNIDNGCGAALAACRLLAMANGRSGNSRLGSGRSEGGR